MTANVSGERADIIARSVLFAIKNQNAREKRGGIREISALIQSDPNMKEILTPPSRGEQLLNDEVLSQKKELEAVRAELRKSLTTRRALTIQADTADRQAEKTKEFMLRAFLALMPYLASGKNRKLKNTFSQIQNLLKRRAPLHELDSVFQQLKTESIIDKLEFREDPAPAEKSSGLSLFKRSSGEADQSVGRFREKYLKIVDDLKAFLDPTGIKEIARIEKQLRNEVESYDLLETQNELKKLLKSYVHRVGLEREEIAGFILDIGERLSEIETKILHCATSLRETGEASARFATAIEEEMVYMQDAVDITDNLEGLKSKVMDSIGHIKEAIEHKRKNEWKHAQQSEEQMARLNKNIKRMKAEMASVEKRARRLEAEILVDSLTNIHSRRAYELYAEKQLQQYRKDGPIFSILLLDVDHFKEINERYGHRVGDICLKGLAQRISPLLEDSGFLARFEGDEFIILLPEALSPGGQKVAEKIRAHIEKTDFLHKKEQVKVTLSIGATEVAARDQSLGDFFGRAEKALYEAKEAGRNRVVFF